MLKIVTKRNKLWQRTHCGAHADSHTAEARAQKAAAISNSVLFHILGCVHTVSPNAIICVDSDLKLLMSTLCIATVQIRFVCPCRSFRFKYLHWYLWHWRCVSRHTPKTDNCMTGMIQLTALLIHFYGIRKQRLTVAQLWTLIGYQGTRDPS